ncbi:hypothetical protein C7Y47_01295 [Lysinibacillus sphaericus]|uniref:Amino acid adenylation domain-containing protein n=1 Tax=Lysinibacillus sphaericus TaxID=1421 RepID=A0A544V0S3_LYSSH|nr:amino acid adenylation domain-containing protein [Lysinibacillus sp. SDF0037]TQR39695.1 hypothetical protein C7Y47_01295 [Lysinibacillus sp. SDF0037]
MDRHLFLQNHERINYMLEKSNVNEVICDDFGVEILDKLNIQIPLKTLHYQELEKICEALSDINGRNKYDNIYLMYTSGSTGYPKAITINNENISPFMEWNLEYFNFTNQDRIIQYHNLSFDFSVWEIFEALLSGGVLHVVDDLISIDMYSFLQYLSINKITVLNVTPTQFRQMLDYLNIINLDAFSSLKFLIFGGEALPSSLVNDAIKVLPSDCEIYNEYGPTEATISSSILLYSEDHGQKYPTIPIGLPTANTDYYVLNNDLAPVLPGCKGELYIGGPGVARGYYQNPDKTEQSFKYFEALDQILYKTGDIVQILEDNNLLFIGRDDSQIKLRGYRIELGEIENAICQINGIDNSVVLLKENLTHNFKYLISFVTRKENVSHLNEETLKKELKKKLPVYMIPQRIMIIDKFPMTPNGKVDKIELDTYGNFE